MTIDYFIFAEIFVSWREIAYFFLESDTATIQMNASDTFPRDRQFHTRLEVITDDIVKSDSLLTNFVAPFGLPNTVDFRNVTYVVASICEYPNIMNI